MIEAINFVFQLALFILLMGLIYAIVQVVEVIREERQRLAWARMERAPVRTEDDHNSPSNPQ